jgi:YggT family protein
MFGQLTYPIVAPVQKIIPPIGMIDISLMIVMIAIFALNRLAYSIFGLYWAIL